MNLRDTIRHHLASRLDAATTVGVAERIGARPERVQTEMLMMHNEGILVVTEWHTVGGRKRPAFQLAQEVK
jgi:hypothetical protein